MWCCLDGPVLATLALIELTDIEAQLGLFAEGIAGRYYHIQPSEEFHSRRLNVAPDTAMLTTDTIYVPSAIDSNDAAVYRMFVLQQLGLREFGSFEFNIDEARRRNSVLGAFTAPDERTRSSDFELFYAHVDLPRILRRLFSLIERARVQACLLQRYPGCRRHLASFTRYQHSESSFESLQSLDDLLYALDAYVDGVDRDILLACDSGGQLDFAFSLIDNQCTAGTSVYDSAQAALTLYLNLIDALDAQNVDELLHEEVDAQDATDWMQREARLEDWEKELAGLDHSLQIEMLSSDSVEVGSTENLENGELRNEDIDIRALQKQRDNLQRSLDMERSAIRDALGYTRPGARSYRYDECNYQSQSYLRHWCRLFEERLWPDDKEEVRTLIQSLKQIIARHSPAVLKQLEQIKPLGYQRIYRVADGDELDFNALIQARQDIRAGVSPDERVYSRKDRVHRDVCAAFLVDLSASTDDPIEPPDLTAPSSTVTAGPTPDSRDPYDDDVFPLNHEAGAQEQERRIIDVQRESMLIMSAALEKLGDSYGVYGFSGYGRDCVEFFVAKEPNEAFTQRTLESIASMTPKRSTRMGPAIRHATRKLVNSGNSLKLLIILSDGFPQDSDYGPERGNHEYGLQDTARALQEAHTKGVETFCVTVDKSGHDYLKRMCPESRYMIIEEIEDLPEALSKVYRSLTGR